MPFFKTKFRKLPLKLSCLRTTLKQQFTFTSRNSHFLNPEGESAKFGSCEKWVPPPSPEVIRITKCYPNPSKASWKPLKLSDKRKA